MIGMAAKGSTMSGSMLKLLIFVLEGIQGIVERQDQCMKLTTNLKNFELFSKILSYVLSYGKNL